MTRTYPLLSTLLVLLFLPAAAARGQLSNYYFSSSTTDPTTMSAPSTLFTGAASDANTLYSVSLGFTFRFNGLTYSTVTMSSNGVMYFGSSALADPNNNFSAAPLYPFIAAFWDDLFTPLSTEAPVCSPPVTPSLRHQLTGVSPNRIRTLEWKDVKLASQASTINNKPLGTFQIRLYETSNKIEVWYGPMNNCDICNGSGGCFSTTASVGIAASAAQFISVSFPGGVPTANRSVASNSVNINPNTGGSGIPANTTLVFGECLATLTGRVGQDNGGTPNLNNGDTFFSGFSRQVGQSAVYRPFDIRMSSGFCTSSYTMVISGSAAADYYFGTPGTQSVVRTLQLGGEIHVPEITFRPTLTGTRSATLTVVAQGITRTFNLAAAAPFVSYFSNVPQGGTPEMQSGDILLQNMRIRRNTSASFSPFTLTNASTASRSITFTITGGGGQYSITPGSTLTPGASITPVISFNATGFGVQSATLQVNAGGQIRTFPLAAISSAPGGEFRIDTKLLDTNSVLFTNAYTCFGSEAVALEVEVENIGYEDYTIDRAVFYEVDTSFRQGAPRYPLRRDAGGNLVVLHDYIVSLQPPTPPYKGDAPNIFPITLRENEKMTFYISFTGRTPGKRFARGYFHTNGENMASSGTNGVLTDGLLAFDAYGRGSGTRLAGDLSGGRPKMVLFPNTPLGKSAQATLHLTNSGVCSLRISMPQLAITNGDVDEFSIITPPTGFIDPETQDLMLAPGASTDIVFAFTPIRTGSRRASLRLVTNDPLLHAPGINEPGVYHVDLYGIGNTDLYLNGITFGEVLIGADAPEHLHDVVRVSNATDIPFTINTITIEGTDAGEFSEDSRKPWPAPGRLMYPGEEIELGVAFAPVAGGVQGDRSATLRLTTTLATESTADLKGVAGTRTMAIAPAAIAFMPMTMGKQQRRMVTITNTGSMKMKVDQPEITGPEAANFHISSLARLELDPGQTEYLEVTYMPLTAGTFTAALSVTGNATNAPGAVLLNGTAFITKGRDDDASTAVAGIDGRGGIEDGVGRGADLSVSGVEGESVASGMVLYQSRPNPASEMMEISYLLPAGGKVELTLYDAQGRLVRMLEEGNRSAGAHEVRVNVGELPTGVYHYRLTAGGTTLTRALHIAR